MAVCLLVHLAHEHPMGMSINQRERAHKFTEAMTQCDAGSGFKCACVCVCVTAFHFVESAVGLPLFAFVQLGTSIARRHVQIAHLSHLVELSL